MERIRTNLTQEETKKLHKALLNIELVRLDMIQELGGYDMDDMEIDLTLLVATFEDYLDEYGVPSYIRGE